MNKFLPIKQMSREDIIVSRGTAQMEQSFRWQYLYYAMFESPLFDSPNPAKTFMDSLDTNWIQTMKGHRDLNDT
jgi:hypothetical protein